MPLPFHEPDRLSALNEYQLLDTPAQEAFDRITQVASLLCETPISLMTLLDDKRQWFKSNVGMPVTETPRAIALCNYVLLDEAPLVVPDTILDERFQHNPLVTADPRIRFYAGYPLTDPDGYVLGSLCVIDQKPRQLTSAQHKALELLSQMAIDLIVEQRQKQQQIKVDGLMELANDLICVAGLDGRFKKINPAFARVLGWHPDELLHHALYEFVCPDDEPMTRQQVESLAAGQPSVEFTHRFRRKDGSYRDLHWVATPEPGTQSLFAIIRDVTPIKQQERELIQSRKLLEQTNQELEKRVEARTAEVRKLHQRYELAIKGAKLGVWEVELETNLVNWDEQLWVLNGLQPPVRQLSQEEYLQTIHPDDRPNFLRKSQSTLAGSGDRVALTYRVNRADGVTQWVETAGRILRDEQGQPIRLMGVAWDVTARKEMEATLQESEQRFREIAENVDDLFWVRDNQEPRFLYMNPTYERYSGYSVEQLYKNPLSFLNLIVEEDRPYIRQAFMNNEPGTNFEFRVHHIDGTIRWLRARVFGIRNNAGTLIRRIGVATDVTHSIEKEQVLEESLRKERLLTHHQKQFITTASHEFRTPLAAIRSSVELAQLYLNREPDMGASRLINKHLETILTKVDALNTLISDTLSHHRAEEGQLQLERIPQDLVAISQELLESAFSAYAAKGRKINLLIVGRAVPVAADSHLIRYLLSSLLNNALKFSSTSPTLTLRFELYAVHILVNDEGIGIPDADLPHIFDRFFRASNAGGIPGAGLGLALCQKYTALLGGQIELKSQVGVGTTVRVSLPYTSVS